MTTQYDKIDYSFKKAAVYRIVVQGDIDTEMSERLWGLQVNIDKGNRNKAISTLIGQIDDQSALAGILNTLHEMHMTVIAVNMLSEIENA